MYVQLSKYKDAVRVRIVEKYYDAHRKQKLRLIRHIGTAHSQVEQDLLAQAAYNTIRELSPQTNIFDSARARTLQADHIRVGASYAYGLVSIVGRYYDALELPDNLLKPLVLARIAYPKSKLLTVEFLEHNFGLTSTPSTIYRFMDSLDKDRLMMSLLTHAQKRAKTNTGAAIAVVFCDVTTLYFETDEEDVDTEKTAGLRKKGYSKDHRYDLPQVVVGLTIDHTGFPLDFQVYEGNTYEGHTLMDGVRSVRAKLSLKAADLTVVADAGMLSQKNIDALELAGYTYIVGARIRSLSRTRTDELLTWDYVKHDVLDTTIDATAERRLIVTYSDKRAKRSRQNRDRLVRRLQARLARGQVVKKSKYTILSTDETLSGTIDQDKVAADAQFDGLKGYVTNTKLTADEVVAQYHNLWNVEKSFRMSKSDLRARPTFHYKKERILAHLLICVCALAVLRELEQQLQVVNGPSLHEALRQIIAIQRYELKTDTYTTTISSELNEIQKLLLAM